MSFARILPQIYPELRYLIWTILKNDHSRQFEYLEDLWCPLLSMEFGDIVTLEYVG